MNKVHPVKDWQSEVVNGETRLGYADWVQVQDDATRSAVRFDLKGAVDIIDSAAVSLIGDNGDVPSELPGFAAAKTLLQEEISVLAGESRPKKDPTFTSLQMEAALCVWEWMLENRHDLSKEDVSKRLQSSNAHDIISLNVTWDDNGSPAMRELARHAGDIVLAVHDRMTAEHFDWEAPYDWEFLPAVLRHIDWDNLNSRHNYSGKEDDVHDIEAIWEHIKSHEADNLSEFDPKQRWISEALAYAHRKYSCRDIVEGHPEMADQSYLDGESPRQYVDDFARKYDVDCPDQ